MPKDRGCRDLVLLRYRLRPSRSKSKPRKPLWRGNTTLGFGPCDRLTGHRRSRMRLRLYLVKHANQKRDPVVAGNLPGLRLPATAFARKNRGLLAKACKSGRKE